MILKNDHVVSGDLTPVVGLKGLVFYDLPLGKGFSLQNELGYDGTGFEYQNFLSDQDFIHPDIQLFDPFHFTCIQFASNGFVIFWGTLSGLSLSCKCDRRWQGHFEYNRLEFIRFILRHRRRVFFPDGIGYYLQIHVRPDEYCHG